MKKILYLIFFTTLFLFFNNVFSAEIKYNTENNIKKAILLEDYITKHKSKIENFIKKYKINNNIDIKNDIKWLNDTIIALKKIQTKDIEKEIAENVIKSILIKIKNINNNLKIKLKAEKNKIETKLNKKKELYSKLWIKLSNKINDINLKIALKIFKNKKELSEKELKIKENLIKLNKESKKLKNFWNINFKSENEIKNSFIRILKNIKKEIDLMKTTIK